MGGTLCNNDAASRRTINRLQLTLATLLAATGVAVAQDATVSAVDEAPDAALLQQLQAGGAEASIQARYRTVGGGQPELRGVAQSFVWPSDASLDRIGLKLSAEQGSVDPFDVAQDYVLELHAVDADSNQTPSTERLAEVTLTIEPADLSDGFLDIDLAEPVALEADGSHLFHLRPAAEQENAAVQRLYFARSDDSDPYGDGVGNQTDGQPRDAGGEFGSRNYDLLFYLVAGD